MNRIRLLPESVANQIAAGEVIERPASAVKELVENALDAQARHIEVEIQAGGRSLIRVTDDGLGMSRDDALLCLERHATSKIQQAEDLYAVTTMGFRGEALPSLASVSRFTLTTREHEPEALAATQVILHGGKIVAVKAAGAPPGTAVEVRQLFYNLPARRKFLRSEETERAHVQHYLTLAALAHPEVAFTFIQDQRLLWQMPAIHSPAPGHSPLAALQERLRAVYGSDQGLLPMDFSAPLLTDARPSHQTDDPGQPIERNLPNPPPPAEDLSAPLDERDAGERDRERRHPCRHGYAPLGEGQAGQHEPQADSPPLLAGAPDNLAANPADQSDRLRVWGFLGAPGVSRATRENQHLFVNRRPVENRGLNFALLEGYHTVLMKGRYPVCCLFLELPPAEVDVNVHPAKREIKFRHENAVRHLVTEAVRQTLLAFHTQGHAGRISAPLPRPVKLPRSAPLRARASELAPARPVTVEAAAGEHARAPGASDLAATGPVAASLAAGERARAPAVPVHAETSSAPAVTPPASVPASLPMDLPRSPALPPSPAPVMTQTADAATPLLAVPLRVVGIIGKLYVVLESDRGLVLLDQHAAHERVLYEQMLDRLDQGNAPSQRLLLPETIELSPRDAQFLRDQLPTLTRLGVGLSEFGERTFLLDALPPFVHMSEARRFVLELVDELKATGQAVNSWRLGEQSVAKTVCRHAVKANDPLAGPELENLLEDLRRCAMPYTCPHGRPTLIELNYRELEKRFGRIQ